MKKIAYMMVLSLIIIPLTNTVNAIDIAESSDIEKVEITNCNTSFIDSMNSIQNEVRYVKYIDFTLRVEEINPKECKITLNGTIETDVGSVTFDNLEITVFGDDCSDMVIKILKSFREE
jgi:hypothetical protein